MEAEVGILERYAAGFDAGDPASFGIQRLLSQGDLVALRALVRRVRVEPSLQAYVVKLVRRTREEPTLSLGASPRAAVALFRAGQARALIEGRDFVVPDDIKTMATAVLRHRVQLTAETEVEGATADGRIEAVLRAVEAPS
jgi:MoxR-like ATPase